MTDKELACLMAAQLFTVQREWSLKSPSNKSKRPNDGETMSWAIDLAVKGMNQYDEDYGEEEEDYSDTAVMEEVLTPTPDSVFKPEL